MPIKTKRHKPFKRKQTNKDPPGKYTKFYNTERWRKIREYQLLKDPLCKLCEKVATVCDHIEPHRGNMDKFWHGPFQSLCEHCHNSVKQSFEKSGKLQRRIGVDGYPIGGM